MWRCSAHVVASCANSSGKHSRIAPAYCAPSRTSNNSKLRRKGLFMRRQQIRAEYALLALHIPDAALLRQNGEHKSGPMTQVHGARSPISSAPVCAPQLSLAIEDQQVVDVGKGQSHQGDNRACGRLASKD